MIHTEKLQVLSTSKRDSGKSINCKKADVKKRKSKTSTNVANVPVRISIIDRSSDRFFAIITSIILVFQELTVKEKNKLQQSSTTDTHSHTENSVTLTDWPVHDEFEYDSDEISVIEYDAILASLDCH